MRTSLSAATVFTISRVHAFDFGAITTTTFHIGANWGIQLKNSIQEAACDKVNKEGRFSFVAIYR